MAVVDSIRPIFLAQAKRVVNKTNQGIGYHDILDIQSRFDELSVELKKIPELSRTSPENLVYLSILVYENSLNEEHIRVLAGSGQIQKAGKGKVKPNEVLQKIISAIEKFESGKLSSGNFPKGIRLNFLPPTSAIGNYARIKSRPSATEERAKLFEQIYEVSIKYLKIQNKRDTIDNQKKAVLDFIKSDLDTTLKQIHKENYNPESINHLEALKPKARFDSQTFDNLISSLKDLFLNSDFQALTNDRKSTVTLSFINQTFLRRNSVHAEESRISHEGVNLEGYYLIDQLNIKVTDRDIPINFIAKPRSASNLIYPGIFNTRTGEITIDLDEAFAYSKHLWEIRGDDEKSNDLIISYNINPFIQRVRAKLAEGLTARYSDPKFLLPVYLEGIFYEEGKHASDHTLVERLVGRRLDLSRDDDFFNKFATEFLNAGGKLKETYMIDTVPTQLLPMKDLIMEARNRAIFEVSGWLARGSNSQDTQAYIEDILNFIAPLDIGSSVDGTKYALTTKYVFELLHEEVYGSTKMIPERFCYITIRELEGICKELLERKDELPAAMDRILKREFKNGAESFTFSII